MVRSLLLFLALFASLPLPASWYWPFGDSDDDPPRLSELVRESSKLIGEASDLAADGKVTEAVEKYRAALAELDRVERENPELSEKVAGGTIKTKRAYIEAAIDSLLMSQVRENARPVAVSETSNLEKRLAEERQPKAAKSPTPTAAPAPAKTTNSPTDQRSPKTQRSAKAASAKSAPLSPVDEIVRALDESDYELAELLIDAELKEKPNDATLLILRAAKESAEGDVRAAERSLDAAIQSNPRSHFAFYNMALLKLKTRTDDQDGARRYYETGRALGGPRDPEIEVLLK